MRSVCFKNLHYQGVVWPPPRAWPSNSAQHFGSPCLLGIFYEIMRFENFFLKIWARLEIFCFELLIFCYGLKFLKLHKGAACAQLLRARGANVIIEGVNHRDFGTNNSNDVQNFRCFYSVHFHVFIVFFARMRKISSSCARNTICLQRDSKKSMFSERAKIVIFWWFSFKKNN